MTDQQPPEEDLPEVNSSWDFEPAAPVPTSPPVAPRLPSASAPSALAGPADRPEQLMTTSSSPRRRGRLALGAGALVLVAVLAGVAAVLLSDEDEGTAGSAARVEGDDDSASSTEPTASTEPAPDTGVVDEPVVVAEPALELEVGDAAQTVKVRDGRVWVNIGDDRGSTLLELDPDTGDVLQEFPRAPFSVHFDVADDVAYLGEVDLEGTHNRLDVVDLQSGEVQDVVDLGIGADLESGITEVIATPEVVWIGYSGPTAGFRLVGWEPSSGDLFSVFDGEFGAAAGDGRGIPEGDTLISFSGDRSGVWVLTANFDPFMGERADDARYTLWHQDGVRLEDVWSFAPHGFEEGLIGVMGAGDRALVDSATVRVIGEDGTVVSEHEGSEIPWIGDPYNRDGSASPELFAKELAGAAGPGDDIAVFDDDQRWRFTLRGAVVGHFLGQPYAFDGTSLWTADDEEGVVARWDFEEAG